MKLHIVLVPLVLAGAVAAGCADLTPPGYSETPHVSERIEYGVVDHIDLYREGSSSPTGLGAVLGGIAGGVVGHQIGGGSGNVVATIAGAVGGAFVGNSMQAASGRDRYRIDVRLDGGAHLELTEVGEGELRVGDRVRVVNGRVYRA
jgi:outer membrane lipoprotein SlyB